MMKTIKIRPPPGLKYILYHKDTINAEQKSNKEEPTMTPVVMGTIREVHARLVSEGYHITENAIRKWTKQGEIHVVYCGNRAIISYESVLNKLMAS